MSTNAKAKKVVAKALTLLGDNVIAKEAINLARAIKGLDKRVQIYLCSEIAHIEQHRNPTRLNAFFDAIAKRGIRTHAMHAFIQRFANVIYDNEAKKYIMRAVRDKAVADDALAMAMTVDWTTFKPEGKVRQFDLDKAAERLLYEAFRNGVDLEQVEAAIAKMKGAAAKRAAEALEKAKAAEPEAAAEEQA